MGPLLFLTLFVLVSPRFSTAQGSDGESYYEKMSRAVIRLEYRDGSSFKPLGTAFFVKSGSDQLFVVTARHVADQKFDLRARVPSLHLTTHQTSVVELRLPSERWVFHPEPGDSETWPVDVAAMRIPGVKDRSISIFQYCPETCPDGSRDQLLVDPLPPQSVHIFGYPLDLGFELREPRPLARQGMVALTTSERFIRTGPRGGSKKLAPAKTFLVDVDAFGGNSGSPVVTYPETNLLGLVSASNDSLDYAISMPVEFIREVLNEAAKQPFEPFGTWRTLPE